MSGIDRQDQMMAYYPCSRKTLRWYKKLFIHVLQLGVVNAYYLHNRYVKPAQLYEFRLEIIRGLLSSRTSIPVQCNRKLNLTEKSIHRISKIEKND